MVSRSKSAMIGSTLFFAALIPGNTALAQDATGDEAAARDEIIVTARKFEEGIQDAPLTVQAYDEQAIRSAGISETADFIQLTSNVTLAESQSISTSFLTVRGLTQVRNGEIPVAVVVDGVLQFNNRQFVGQLFDVEQIEVVKGPQGALYGRNATGGAIIISTKKPGDEREGYVAFGIGSGDEVSAEGSFSTPLIEDKLYFKASGRIVNREGYFDNITLNEKDDPYFDRALRGRLLWTPTDDLTVDLIGNYTRHNGRGIGFQFGVESADDASKPFESNNEDRGERQTNGLSLRIKKDFGWGTLTSVSSYDYISTLTRADQFPYTMLANGVGDGAPFGDGTQSQFTDIEGFSQEIRLTSPTNRRFLWEVGGYYLDWERFISSTTGLDNGGGVRRIERTPFFDADTNPTTTFFADDNDNRAWAVFGQLSYNFTDQMELNIAARYDEEERDQSVSPLQRSGIDGVGEPGTEKSQTFDKFSPKVTLRYTPAPNLNIYGSWGQGFRSGQFNQDGVAAVAQREGIEGVNDIVDQEDSESFEIGFKSDFFNDRLRLNGAWFDTTVEGQQYFVFIGGVGAQVLINIDEVDINGFEAEAIWRATDNLDLYASYGRTDAEIVAYTTDPTQVGNTAPYVPDETFNAGFQWTSGLGSLPLDLVARLDYERRGEQFWSPENEFPRSPLDLVNVRVAVQDAEGVWELAGEVNNLTDEEYNSEFVIPAFSHKANPRVVRAGLRYNF
ncbi:MAG: TonB-dependent receptor [Hyphomonadaceae bacterium]|nr:TonB-dependent receptor [Hyphomonadaceae bacterium]